MRAFPLFKFRARPERSSYCGIRSQRSGASSPHESRTPIGARELAARGPSLKLRKIAARPVKAGQHTWRIGIRLGPLATDGGANSMQPYPPALHKVGVRVILDVLSAPGQVGYPSSMNTDACLGYSAVGYQSSGQAFTPRDVGRNVSVRLMGQSPKGHTGVRGGTCSTRKRRVLPALRHPDPRRHTPLLCALFPRCSGGSRNATSDGIWAVGMRPTLSYRPPTVPNAA